MNTLVKLLFSLVAASACYNSYANILALRGMNGGGSNPEYVASLLQRPLDEITDVPTPGFAETPGIPDFSQQRCIGLLAQQIGVNPSHNLIIHATSQGGGTALNCAAQLARTNRDLYNKIKCLILEAPMASGNSATLHTVQHMLPQPLSWLPHLPGSYYFLPYLTKLIESWEYRPAGTQAIKSVSQIPNNLPIILAHNHHDPQLSYQDTRALYYKLRAQGNNNVYLVEGQRNAHMWFFNNGSPFRLDELPESKKSIVRQLLARHGLAELTEYDRQHPINVAEFQPDFMQYRHLYDSLISKEHVHEHLANHAVAYGIGATVVATACCAGILYAIVQKIKHRAAQRRARNQRANRQQPAIAQ